MSTYHSKALAENLTPPELDPDPGVLELVRQFVEAMEITEPEEIQLTQGDVLMAAQYLHETAPPRASAAPDGQARLRWEAFASRGFFRRIAHMSRHEREGVGLHLMGFFGWLIFGGQLDPLRGQQILAALRDAAPRSPILADLYRCAELQILSLRSPAALRGS